MIISRETKYRRGLELVYDEKLMDIFVICSLINNAITDSVFLTPKEVEKLYKKFGKILEEMK